VRHHAFRGLALALLSGALLALAFPRYGHPALAFIALVPLYVALSGWSRAGLRGVSAWRGFRLGLATGAVHFTGTLYWTSNTVATFGGLPWAVAIPVAGLLVLYMALYPALASAATGVVVHRFGAGGLVIAAPAIWVATEYARAYAFGGFPWIPLGNAVVSLLPVAQLASITGVYGLSWLLAVLHACIALVAIGTGRARVLAGVTGLVLLTTTSVWGAVRMQDNRLTTGGEAITVGLIQGNVPQGQKWDPAHASTIFERYLSMSRDAVAAGARWLLWPESATPFFFDEDPRAAAEVRRLVREEGAVLLFGTDEVERGSPTRLYNSAFMLDRAGDTAAVYRKIHLVPFGEYVPFANLLTFVGPLVESVASFSPGERVTMLPVGEHMASTAICYEVVYPHLIRRAILNGSELLTTITNDAWYGESSAAFQHFELARMRAIEQGRYLARAANTGISGIVDPYGRVVARTALFETTTVIGQVRFQQARTVYATIGDLPAQLAVFLSLMSLGLALWPASGTGRHHVTR
jgi:apolipoprotein N-acyltransferase